MCILELERAVWNCKYCTIYYIIDDNEEQNAERKALHKWGVSFEKRTQEQVNIGGVEWNAQLTAIAK